MLLRSNFFFLTLWGVDFFCTASQLRWLYKSGAENFHAGKTTQRSGVRGKKWKVQHYNILLLQLFFFLCDVVGCVSFVYFYLLELFCINSGVFFLCIDFARALCTFGKEQLLIQWRHVCLSDLFWSFLNFPTIWNADNFCTSYFITTKFMHRFVSQGIPSPLIAKIRAH